MMTIGKPEQARPPFFSVQEVQERIDRVPFSTFLGLRVNRVDDAGVELSMPCRAEMLGNPEVGSIHGGILASALDVACSYAVMIATSRSVVTVDLRTDYHRPAFSDSFTISASVLNSGRTLSVAQGEVRNGEGKLIASGRAVMMHSAE